MYEGAIDVFADSGQIEQVLMNLATNARDAMSECGTFTIATEVIDIDNEFIKIHGVRQPRRIRAYNSDGYRHRHG